MALTLTPQQRRAKIEAAKALLQEADADLPITESPPTVPAQGTGPDEAKPAPVVPAPVTGPGGDTRATGQPSLADTMKTVWAKMRGA